MTISGARRGAEDVSDAAPASDGLLIWQDEKTSSYHPLDRPLPVVEDYLTQIAAGPTHFSNEILVARDVALVRQETRPLTVGGSVLDPDHFALLVPVRWQGDNRINGTPVRHSSVYIMASPDGFCSRGHDRELIAVGALRSTVIETLAALRGVGPEDVRLEDGMLELPPPVAGRLRRGLATLFRRCKAWTDVPGRQGLDPVAVRDEALGYMIECCLFAGRHLMARRQGVRRPEQIVRRAEERFIAAAWGPVSLADLCAAAGVSQATLYNAFRDVCGEPPLRYFQKRRLMQARSILTEAQPSRGAVTRAASDVGLTEFGRFSVEYRQMFGESPSVTLAGSANFPRP